MQHLRTINLIVLPFALLCLTQTVTAESAKATTKVAPQNIKGITVPAAIKKIPAPVRHKKKASSENKNSTQGKKMAIQLKAIPKVVPQSVKKMVKPFSGSNVVKPAVGAKVKGIPGVTGNSQGGAGKRVVTPAGISEFARPANNRGDFQGFANGSSRGSDGRPSNQSAADAIRNAAASGASQARITSITPQLSGYSCVVDFGARRTREFIISGSRFGSAADGRTVKIATRVRNATVAEAEIISWSDSRIVATLPYRTSGIQPPQRYVVGLKNSAGHWVSNSNHELSVCPPYIEVTGRITLDRCSANINNIKIGLRVNGHPQRDLFVRAVPGDGLRYIYRMDFMPQLDLQLTPKLVGTDCPGGKWSPLNNTIRLGVNRSRATQNFDYRWNLNAFQIPMKRLASIVRTAFTGTTIRLNNYNPTTRGERKWDSTIKLSDALGGTKRILGIPPSEGSRTYYINDINLNDISVVPAGNMLRIRFSFEDAGMEFIGQCKGSDECIAEAPDVQANIQIDVYIALKHYMRRDAPRSISYGSVRVVATLNAQTDGICQAFDGLCRLFSDYKSIIKRSIENGLYDELNTTRVRDQVANALSSTLSGLRISRVNSAEVEGKNFVIRYILAE